MCQSFSGYQNARNMIDIDADAIIEIEEYAQLLPSILRQHIDPRWKNADQIIEQMLDLFFDIYFKEGTPFKFPPGHKRLLISLAETVRSKIEVQNESGIEFDLSYFNVDEGFNNCATIRTPIGTIYYEKPKKQLKRKPCDTVSNPDDSDNSMPDLIADMESVRRLVKYLEADLFQSVAKKVNSLTMTEEIPFWKKRGVDLTHVLKLEMVTVDMNAVLSVLKTNRVGVPTTEHPNEGCKLIAGTVKCFCSAAGVVKINIFFIFKSRTLELIKKCIESSEHTEPLGYWDLCNFDRHIKSIHKKLYNKNVVLRPNLESDSK